MSRKRFQTCIETLAEVYPDARCSLDFQDRFQLLSAVMLSAQTTDAAVNKVTPALFRSYPDPVAMAHADPAEVEAHIRTIGLAPTKARNLVGTAKVLITRFDGRVPGSMTDLTSLPGVGRKTANVVLGVGFGQPAVTVDTHVSRLATRIGLVKTKDREAIEHAIRGALPRRLWTLQAHLLIAHGRTICTARKPRCESCPITRSCARVGVT